MAIGTFNSPKIEELLKWSKIAEVNAMLDEGVAPSQVCKWINNNGFKISAPMIYEYRDKRKLAMIKDINLETAINPIDKNQLFKGEPKQYISKKNGVKNELEVLDKIIQRGAQTLDDMDDLPISPQMLMKAIEVKNNITKGSHEHLTAYGIEDLKIVEQGKFQAVLGAVLQFIPEEQRENVINAIEVAEDEYYRTTEYYESYLATKAQQQQEVEPTDVEYNEEE